MSAILGSCHCGNIQFEFVHPDFNPNSTDRLPVRTCTCSFCVKHGGVYTSHPQGQLTAQIDDESLVQIYQFGTKTAHFYICKRCGIFPFVASEIEGNLYAVVNVNTFENIGRFSLEPMPMDFEAENVDSRLERRTRTWIANVKFKNSEP